MEKAASREAKGIVAIDLENGKITPHELEKDQAAKFLSIEATAKVGEFTLKVNDELANNPKQPHLQKRTLTATKGDKKQWEREILAPIIHPPLP